MTRLDDTYAAMSEGDAATGLAFYRALADADLFLLLTDEALGALVSPQVFDLAEGPVVLAFDSEERLAGFSDGPQPYAVLPGRVVALQMAGQGLSLGLNLGSGAASEVILPPGALDWLLAMLDQAAPVERLAGVAAFGVPLVPEAVATALQACVDAAAGHVGRGLLVAVQFQTGGRGEMLVLTGVAVADQDRMARAVTEALAFSGVEAAALDVAFLAADDPILQRIAEVALVFRPVVAVPDLRVEPSGPGMDPARPPVLR